MRAAIACLVLTLSLWTVPAAAQAPAPAPVPIPVETLGPQPGTRVPAFTATDQAGRAHTLQSLVGPKGAMLVFSRSADW